MNSKIKDLKTCSVLLVPKGKGMECVFKGTHKQCEDKLAAMTHIEVVVNNVEVVVNPEDLN